jgi:hypothetical protein
MQKKIWYLLTLFFFLSSCSIEGTSQGLTSYYKKTRKNNPELFYQQSGSGLCEMKHNDSSKIAIINGIQLKNCITKCEKSIVYIWNPKCHSRFCYSLDALQRKCDVQGIELFVVAEYYDAEKMKFKYIIERPIFGINTKYYKSNFTSRYLSNFINDLTGVKDVYGNLIQFGNGNYLKSYNEMDSIQ